MSASKPSKGPSRETSKSESAKPRPRRGKGRQPTEQAVGSEAILEATTRLLQRLHPDQITGLEISREAGVDPALVRYYYGGRSGVIAAAIRNFLVELSSRQASRIRDTDTPKERIRARVGALIGLLSDHPNLHDVFLHGVVRGEAIDLGDVIELRERLIMDSFHAIDELVRSNVEAGVFRPVDTKSLFVAYIGMCEFAVNGRALLELLEGRQISADEANEHFAEFIADLIVSSLTKR